MKKIILPLLLLSFNAFSQLQPGFYPSKGYVFEDFATISEYSSVHWTNTGPHSFIIDSLVFATKECKQYPGTINYRLERKPATKTGVITVSQPYGSYEQIYLEFGKELQGKQKTLDLSKGNANLSFNIKNTSTYNLMVWFSIYDSTGSKINSVGTHLKYDSYLDFMDTLLAPNQSVSHTINFNKNGYEALFKKVDCYAGVLSGQDFSFNKSLVSKIGISIVNYTSNSVDSYKPFKIDNATVEISDLKIGDLAIINSIEDSKEDTEMSIFPNPSKSQIHFSKPLQNIILTDLSGNVVLKRESALELDIANLPNGNFLLHSSSLLKPRKIVKQ